MRQSPEKPGTGTDRENVTGVQPVKIKTLETESKREKTMKVLKRAGTVVISVLLWAVILIAALYAFTTMATRDNQNVANLFDYTPLVVKSDSMAPVFETGDLILIKKCDPSTLKVGDIICFHTIIENEYALNTHRIKEIEAQGDVRSYVTIGDNNNGIADQHIISDGDIVGIYVGCLPKLGRVMDFLSGSTGFLAVIILPMLLFFVYQVYHLIMISIRLKKAVAAEEAAEREQAVQAEEKEANVQTKQSQADTARELEEARAALEEAKRMREEAEALKAQAQAELDKAKQNDGEGGKQ